MVLIRGAQASVKPPNGPCIQAGKSAFVVGAPVGATLHSWPFAGIDCGQPKNESIMLKTQLAVSGCDGKVPANPARENHMAERKSALKRAPKRPELDALLEKAKATTISDEMLQEQRASFVYGNAPKGSRITKESARRAASKIRVTAA